jgi:outer membrane protein
VARTTEAIRRATSGNLVVARLVLASLTGCAVPVRAPYTAAPPSDLSPWRAPAAVVARNAQVLASYATPVSIDPAAVYGLADLIDFAHRRNPETRRAWEEARAAAAQVAQAEASYYPTLAFMGSAGTSRIVFGAPTGTFTITGPGVEPALQAQWILLDFGRRSSDVEQSGEDLVKANFTFNRKLQEVAFAVSRNYFSFDASRARVTAARATLQSAVAVEEAVRARNERGLATRPELLLARQESARAVFDLESALGSVADAQAALAESLGIPPTALMVVADLSTLPLPTGLTDSVERRIDRTLRRRPDLAAQLAALRAREAAVRRASAEYLPRFLFSGSVDQVVQRYISGPPFARFTTNETEYHALLKLEWTLFDGFGRDNALREVRSLRDAAAADLAASALKVMREVWQAYAHVRTTLRQHDYAVALLAAAQEAYDATLAAYRSAGLATVLDLLTAQRDLASARATLIQSRADLLTAAAALTFAAGD